MKWVKAYWDFDECVHWINLDHVWQVEFIAVLNDETKEKLYDSVQFSVSSSKHYYRWAPKFKTEAEAMQAFGNLIGAGKYEYRNKESIVIETAVNRELMNFSVPHAL